MLRDALKACLSESDFPAERRQAVLRAVRKEEKPVKRKISAALVFAVVLTLALGSAAFAASLGVFGLSAGDDMNEQSAGRLERLEDAATTYNDTQIAQAPEAPAPSPEQTVYDQLLEGLYERRFNLTLNQAYFDGYKLYYSYTLTADSPLASLSGEGMPTGFDSWDMQAEGKYVMNFVNADDNIERGNVTFFAAHPVGYIARESMGLGDGAWLDGKPLIILDSGEERIDDHTIQGFQEVQMPEGFEPADTIDIDLSILFGATVYYQDEENVYMSHISLPENRGIFHLPFTVALDGETKTYAGTVTTSAYSAAATIRVSDVDISGEVVFDAPEWAAAFEANVEANMNGGEPTQLSYIGSYTLIADGVEYHNLDGAHGVNEDGQFIVRIRYDLPESMSSLVLRPTSSGIPYTPEATQHENEEIILIQ